MGGEFHDDESNDGHDGVGEHGDDSDEHADAFGAGHHELHHGPALHDEAGKVHGRHEDHLCLRRQDGCFGRAEPLHGDGGRHVLGLLHDEWDDGLLLQPHHGDVQVRNDRLGRLCHLHQWRQELLRDDSGLLRRHLLHDEVGLHRVPDDEWHGVLLLLGAGPRTMGPPLRSRRWPIFRRAAKNRAR